VAAIQITDFTGEKSTTRIRLTPDNSFAGVTVGDLAALVPAIYATVSPTVNGAINQITIELPYVASPEYIPGAGTFQSVDHKVKGKYKDLVSGDTLILSLATPALADFLVDQETVDTTGPYGTMAGHFNTGISDGTNLWFLTTEDGAAPVTFQAGKLAWANRKGGNKPL